MLETLSLLVHADSKAGKTTLASTCPVPILAMDAEGGWKFLPVRFKEWDPRTGPPPLWDGTWDVCHVTVREFDTMRLIYQWLAAGQHNFRSIVMDSITEIQRRCKQSLGTDDLRQQEWGKMLTLMDGVIRGFRDLTLHATNPVQVAVFVAETRETNGKYRPYMQGQIGVALPYWMDIVGFLFVQPWLSPDGQPYIDAAGQQVLIRRLLVSPHAQYEAGERVQGRLGQVVEPTPPSLGPNITEMLLRVYPQLQQPQAQPA